MTINAVIFLGCCVCFILGGWRCWRRGFYVEALAGAIPALVFLVWIVSLLLKRSPW